ncbi:MAG: hypothetical protein U5K81_01220 [Trueperaceae bacterium]|nr:hypothetical protein [Trueperaceae bacterium]
MVPSRTLRILGVLAVALVLGSALAQDPAERLEALEAEVERLRARVAALEEAQLRHGPLLAQRHLEAAAFHAIDDALAAGEMDPRFAETVHAAVLSVEAVSWPEGLRDPVQAFLADARDLEAALRAEDVDAAADAATRAHDAQHVLSHAISSALASDGGHAAEAHGDDAVHEHANEEEAHDEGAAADAPAVPEEAVRISIEIGPEGGAVGGAQTHRVQQGDTVAFTFASEASGELHLHGLGGDWALTAGTETVALVEATAPGRFPMELHPEGEADGVTIAYLEVHP